MHLGNSQFVSLLPDGFTEPDANVFHLPLRVIFGPRNADSALTAVPQLVILPSATSLGISEKLWKLCLPSRLPGCPHLRELKTVRVLRRCRRKEVHSAANCALFPVRTSPDRLGVLSEEN
jgi:hypothetical protein